jgi:hypothetical protein
MLIDDLCCTKVMNPPYKLCYEKPGLKVREKVSCYRIYWLISASKLLNFVPTSCPSATCGNPSLPVSGPQDSDFLLVGRNHAGIVKVRGCQQAIRLNGCQRNYDLSGVFLLEKQF